MNWNVNVVLLLLTIKNCIIVMPVAVRVDNVITQMTNVWFAVPAVVKDVYATWKRRKNMNAAAAVNVVIVLVAPLVSL